MANVSIYEVHREILDALITSRKVASAAGGTETGPFRDQRDAYVFAVSIALALNIPTPLEGMPKSRSGTTNIRDSVFLGADGAKELAIAVALLTKPDQPSTRESLALQLELISEDKLEERLALLDQFAHAGFDWLAERKPDESNVRDLVLSTIEEVQCLRFDGADDAPINDPLIDMLNMQLDG